MEYISSKCIGCKFVDSCEPPFCDLSSYKEVWSAIKSVKRQNKKGRRRLPNKIVKESK